jgi:hypothetical protein
LTDRSKSQRRRRLQLNAEEFAPPADLYEASAEPRLDETWVQYYGGEKQGGLKRLLTVDEEAEAAQPEGDAGEVSAADRADDAPGAKHQEEPPPASPEVQEEQPLSAAQPERPQRPVVSSLEEFRRHEPAKAAVPRARSVRRAAEEPTGLGAVSAEAEEQSSPPPEPSSLPAPAAESGSLSFEEWSKRWSPWLKRGGSIKVCAAFFELTHARGSAECFTSNSAIMGITRLSRAQCIRNIHYLIEMGFLDELSEVNSREAKGTYYRFNLVPRSLVTT